MLPHKTDNRRTFRLSDEEYSNLQRQAKQLGLNASEYIRLIIALDTATEIIKRLGGKGK
jgi:predicted DNA binding CopG/RHH family protein